MADVIICDDQNLPEGWTVNLTVSRQWLETTVSVSSSKRDKKSGMSPIITIRSCLHEADLIGQLRLDMFGRSAILPHLVGEVAESKND